MSEAESIVITGTGVLSPLADSPAALTSAIAEGRCALQDAADMPGVAEARIADFDSNRYATVRGMRVYNRTTQLGICAAKLALDQAKIVEGAVANEQLGVVFATSYGHLDTLCEYDRSLLVNGMARTNPALMPLALLSAPGAATALAFAAKACSITLGGGTTSVFDAIGLASRLLAAGRARAVVVVSAFSPCRELVLSASRAGMLSALGDHHVFDRRHRGTAFGEAAAAVVLERADYARERGVTALGGVLGTASTFAPLPADASGALTRACASALESAKCTSKELAFVSAGANGIPESDRAEAQALLQVLAAGSAEVPVTASKGQLGESIDTSGALSLLLALSALQERSLPGIFGFEEPAVPGLRYAARPTPIQGQRALLTTLSHTGAASALVLSGAA